MPTTPASNIEAESPHSPRIAIVTGGAGTIGRAIVSRLRSADYAPLIADLDETTCQRVAADLGAAGYFAADLTTEKGAADLVNHACSLGTLTTVVNAAGISPKASDGGRLGYLEIGADDFVRVLAVNLLAPFLVIREAAPHLRTDGAGSIVNIGSITARLGSAGPGGKPRGPLITSGLHYSASKAALHNLAISLSRELAERAIRINTVAPGYVATTMTAVTPSRTEEAIIQQIPLGRPATPEDIAATVTFLVSDESRYLTGAVLDVNGGWLPAL